MAGLPVDGIFLATGSGAVFGPDPLVVSLPLCGGVDGPLEQTSRHPADPNPGHGAGVAPGRAGIDGPDSGLANMAAEPGAGHCQCL